MDFPGWHLIGTYPDGDPGDVGSWLLVHGGEAMLLEVPEGLKVADVRKVLAETGATLKYVTASHAHWDHLDTDVWGRLQRAYPSARFLHPAGVRGDHKVLLGDEPIWLVKAPKHSMKDVVTVFRGVAMTGDIELGMLASVNDEVPDSIKRDSMKRLEGFEKRCDYHVNAAFSAHLTDFRLQCQFSDLFLLRRVAVGRRN